MFSLDSVLVFSRNDSLIGNQWAFLIYLGYNESKVAQSFSFPSPGDLPHPGFKSPALQADALPSEPPEKLGYNSMKQIT